MLASSFVLRSQYTKSIARLMQIEILFHENGMQNSLAMPGAFYIRAQRLLSRAIDSSYREHGWFTSGIMCEGGI